MSASSPQDWGGARVHAFDRTRVDRRPGVLRDARRCRVDAPPHHAFRAVRRIGGDTGYYAFDRLWALRARIDGWLGGIGLRRGRRHPEDLRVGETVDWWRVDAFDPRGRLRLRAEAKLPGRAWLELRVQPCGRGALIHQVVVFEPDGWLGIAYWKLLRPLHDLVFARMLEGLARAARSFDRPEARHAAAEAPVAPASGPGSPTLDRPAIRWTARVLESERRGAGPSPRREVWHDIR